MPDLPDLGGKRFRSLFPYNIEDRVKDDLRSIKDAVASERPARFRGGRPRKTLGGSLREPGRTHNRKMCRVCQLPRHVGLRIEEDFVNWHSCRQIADWLWETGQRGKDDKPVSQNSVYNHCVAFGLDLRRASTLERGVARLVDHGFNMLETGQMKMTGSDLIAAITLWARLNGRFSDQTINNILIRNQLPTLEEIAKEKDPGRLGDRAALLVRQLQDAGVLGGGDIDKKILEVMGRKAARDMASVKEPVQDDPIPKS